MRRDRVSYDRRRLGKFRLIFRTIGKADERFDFDTVRAQHSESIARGTYYISTKVERTGHL